MFHVSIVRDVRRNHFAYALVCVRSRPKYRMAKARLACPFIQKYALYHGAAGVALLFPRGEYFAKFAPPARVAPGADVIRGLEK